MYSDEYQAVIDKLNEFIAEQPSQEEAAKILGISSSILTPYQKGYIQRRYGKVYPQNG